VLVTCLIPFRQDFITLAKKGSSASSGLPHQRSKFAQEVTATKNEFMQTLSLMKPSLISSDEGKAGRAQQSEWSDICALAFEGVSAALVGGMACRV
jgi:hypothetical protein